MASDTRELVFDMAQGRSLRFGDAVAHRVFCLGGSLALTRHNDPHAAVLIRGDSYLCDGSRPVNVHALTDARVRLLSPPDAPAPTKPRSRAARLWGMLRTRAGLVER